jgi:hypothetical protein
MDDKKASPPKDSSDKQVRSIASFVVSALVAAWVFQILLAPVRRHATELTYSDFKAKLAAGEVAERAGAMADKAEAKLQKRVEATRVDLENAAGKARERLEQTKDELNAKIAALPLRAQAPLQPSSRRGSRRRDARPSSALNDSR